MNYVLRNNINNVGLLTTFGSYVSNYKVGSPNQIINRRKRRFVMLVAQRLAVFKKHNNWANLFWPVHPTTPWAWRWAVTVAESFF